MQILMVAAENAAIKGAKVGGIADVIRDVPIALSELGHQIEVVIPSHNNYQQHYPSALIGEVKVYFKAWHETLYLYEVYQLRAEQVERQFVLSHASFSANNGNVYCYDDPYGAFASDANKFALFNLGVAQCIKDGLLTRPDVLHLHDWHAAFLPVLVNYHHDYQCLKDVWRVFTIHNLAIQGIRPIVGVDSSFSDWFPEVSFEQGLLTDPRYPDCFNPMRAGINLSDKVHVVSPTYALEVLKPSDAATGLIAGEGLEQDLMRKHQSGDLLGILNGCDYDEQPEVLKSTKAFLSAAKAKLIHLIAEQLHVPSDFYLANEKVNQWQNEAKAKGPLVTSVGRLTPQKVSLLVEPFEHQPALSALLDMLANRDGRMILLGCGDQQLAHIMTKLMAKHDNFLFINAYDQQLSDSLYTLGDLFLMPSAYEPCGISQLLAMRAGQPCLVNAVGGLADTVSNNETGFVFSGDNNAQKVGNLLLSFQRAITLFTDEPNSYREIAKQAEKRRFTWNKSVQEYVEKLYRVER
ncbi:glycogen synthase [Thalassotalea marina]|uniref:starch synthase n=1 Tax=Thalassotalea marina TaxID=1673741 RepID=A0A919BJX3_9GAMM|nr:glycogen/starch synthase [Thalassotalea marina]GHF95108.1 glycogen synthase [Thalassotalea marina]